MFSLWGKRREGCFFVCALELWIVFTLLYKTRRLFKKPSYWELNHILLKQVFHLVEMSTKMCASPFNSFFLKGALRNSYSIFIIKRLSQFMFA